MSPRRESTAIQFLPILSAERLVHPPSAAIQYLLAAFYVAVAVLLRAWMFPTVGVNAPLLAFVFPTVLSAMFGRFGPPLFATGLSALAGAYFFMEPVGQLLPLSSVDQLRIAGFIIQNVLLAALMSGLQRARLRSALASAAAAETAHLLEAIVRSTPHAIIAINQDGTVRAWNAAAESTFGWKAEEVIGRPIPAIPEDFRTDFDALRKRAAAGETLSRITAERLRKDGSRILCELTLGPLYDDHRRITGIVGTVTDVSAQRAVEEQLRQAQKMEAVGELAAGVAHDFNNQLTAIMGYAQLVRGGLAPGAAVREDLQQIERAAESAAALTRQLLTFSRRQVLQMRTLDLGRVVRDSEKLLRRTVRENVIISTRLFEEAAWIRADRAQLEHVLLNLVVNARDAMPDGGSLRIETRVTVIDRAYASAHLDVSPGDYVVLSVIDTGMGMSKETQRRVFEPFFTTKPSGTGTGLGLAMVYGAVRQMGGSISLDSEPGRGTTFGLYFPRLANGADAAPLGDEQTIVAGRGTVLLVDDDDSVRRLTTRTLQRAGYDVTAASNGAEAITIVERDGPPDLLLTDVVMPGMSGPALAEALARDHGVTNVLFTSGYSDQPDLRDQVERGEVEFLAKPFTTAAVTSAVRRLLRS